MLCILNFYFNSFIFINIYGKSIIIKLLEKKRKRKEKKNRHRSF